MTIDELKAQGCEVVFNHYRVHVRSGELGRYFRGRDERAVATKGGQTFCIIRRNGQEVIGIALCSHRDNFSYRLGREISFGRALKEAVAKGIIFVGNMSILNQ